MDHTKVRHKKHRMVLIVGGIVAGLLAPPQAGYTSEASQDGWTSSTVVQGDFEITVRAFERWGGDVCVWIENRRTWQLHHGCSDATVSVADDLSGATSSPASVGYTDWVYSKNPNKPPTARAGTISISGFSWTGQGAIVPGVPSLDWNIEFRSDAGPHCHFCPPTLDHVHADVTSPVYRSAATAGTVTDSQWGTFDLTGVLGTLTEDLTAGSEVEQDF